MTKWKITVEWPKVSYELEAKTKREAIKHGEELFDYDYDQAPERYEPAITATPIVTRQP